ncbi:MAG: phosphogluconate dehydratase [Flavobacteriales bacterium]|nr:phosphogluconate dehydratase [Flavobacteriales bacterium]
MNRTVQEVTQRIIDRSKAKREAYLSLMQRQEEDTRSRSVLSCGNLAHAFAACNLTEKERLSENAVANLAIVSAYNDMLSAHKTYENYPDQIRQTALENGAVAQFAGGVPAMCDGVTQGQTGMELSLLSREVIALSTAVALSHNMFDGVMCLGICDKIVPGLLMGALKFGHLPTIFIPGGPMKSGITNDEKAAIRERFANGEIGREELLKGESASYHSVGTCTFYGTANSNQMLMEIMGLHLPGSSFVNPDTPLRHALTDEAVKQLIHNTRAESRMPLYKVFDERTLVNGIVGLLATGGSTNHTLHLVAIARCAGMHLEWQDISDLSAVIPSITKVYPNGKADVNHFHAAGGMPFVIRTLLDQGLLHRDVNTVVGFGLDLYTREPVLNSGHLEFRQGAEVSLDDSVIRPANNPFDAEGGIKVIHGDLGVGIVKVSAVSSDHRVVEAPAVVFEDQDDLIRAFKAGKLNRDFIAVVRYQGPQAKGMPELHKLTPTLSILQHNGYRVALVTDGRMSGASGKVPAAIHISPEALCGGAIGLIQDGDMLRLDCNSGELLWLNKEEAGMRQMEAPTSEQAGCGRELFDPLRRQLSASDQGATLFD